MTKEKLMDLTEGVLVFILIAGMSFGLLYCYTQMSQKDKDLIFWITVTQPQE